jgi:hypothetical protein
VVVSGVVLHPDMPTNPMTGRIQSNGVFFMCASAAWPIKG